MKELTRKGVLVKERKLDNNMTAVRTTKIKYKYRNSETSFDVKPIVHAISTDCSIYVKKGCEGFIQWHSKVRGKTIKRDRLISCYS